MVSRCEIDLFNIRKEFKETHDASLHEFIQVETMIVSRSFCLLTLLSGVLCSHLICVSLWSFFFFLSHGLCPDLCECVLHILLLLLLLLLRWGGGVRTL